MSVPFRDIVAHAREAAKKAENINADGSINWNFVSSDCFIDLKLGWNNCDGPAFTSGRVEAALELVADELGV